MRVLVAGDIRLLCEGLAHYLRRVPEVTVIAVAKTGAEAIANAFALRPDIALVDMAMPDSLHVVRQIAERARDVRIVALSVPEDGGAVIACAEAGISAYVVREGSLDDLIVTLRSVMRGEAPVSPRIAAALLRRVSGIAAGVDDDRAASPLTTREAEVVALVEQGLSNKQIARRLQIRLPTVKNHVHHILGKLHVNRRSDIPARLGRRAPAGGQVLDRPLNLS